MLKSYFALKKMTKFKKYRLMKKKIKYFNFILAPFFNQKQKWDYF